MKVLHVAAEVYPLVKTGGLADVVAALPVALAEQGCDVRLLLPGFPAVLEGVQMARTVLDIGPCFGALRVRLVLARMPGTRLPVYVIDAPYLYRRKGGPYQNPEGEEWHDNLQRFALLGWVAAHLAAGDADLHWSPAIIHAHDWHAAMSCAYLADHAGSDTGSVFTIHNMAFQGLFPMHDWPLLGLGSRLMSPAGLEFHGQLSFMKAGLKFADRVTTVSPTYAREIATHEFGFGLEGVIRSRETDVSGILNGIDDAIWDPARDKAIAASYDAKRLEGKLACRRALQAELGLDADDEALLVVVVSRLTSQKGLDLLLSILPTLVEAGVQVAVQGSGEPTLEAAFRIAQQSNPRRLHVRIGYDEACAHRLIAGADAMAVPSRFEPCGLTQMYALRYGTVPIVRRVGGLADSVIDDHGPSDERSTGFVFGEATPEALLRCILRARDRRRLDRSAWLDLVRRGMAQRFSWSEPARLYRALYEATGAVRRGQTVPD